MDKKSKLFFIFFFVLIGASIVATYHRTIVVRDYPVIETEVSEE